MEEIKIKKFDISEVDEITLLSIEEAEKIPKSFRACGDWWWLRSPGYSQGCAVLALNGGDIFEGGYNTHNNNLAVRPAFRINNLKSEIGDKILINKTWCTVIDKGLVFADYPICKHRFDSESNDWETSEIKSFINSEEFKLMI